MYLGLGWLFFALGFIGAFLPVLPTTPFMILALGCFSKGSESLHNWLYNHPKYGPVLQDWDQHRMIPLKAKMTAITMMTISAAYLIFLSNIPNVAIIVSLGLMSWGAIYILTKPSRPAPAATSDTDQNDEESEPETENSESIPTPEKQE